VTGAHTSITIQGGDSVVVITRPAWWHLAVAYALGAIVGCLAARLVW
jgi:hypothetical protein